MKYKTLVLGLVLWSLYSVSHAQENQPPGLSELFESAATYPGLKAETEKIEMAKLSHRITKRELWPAFDLQAQNTIGTYEGAVGGFFPTAGIFNVSGDGTSGHTAVNTLISATVKWKFLQFGKHRDRVKLAKTKQNIAENDFVLEDVRLKKRISSIYLNWHYACYMLRWADEERQRNKELLEIAESLVRSGLSSSADSLLAKTTLKKAIADKHKWEGEVEHYVNKIKEYTGLELADNKPMKKFLVPPQKVPVEKQDETHPVLIGKDRQKEAVAIRRKHVTHQVYPDISILGGGMLRGTGFSEQGSAWGDSYELPIDNYLVGVGLTWDISKFYSKGLKKRRLNHRETKIEEEREGLKRHLDQEKKSLAYKIDKALQEIENTEEAYQAAQQSFKLFKVRYEKGLIDLTALLQIQQTLQFTEKSRIRAYRDYWMFRNNYAYIVADFSPLTTQFNQ